MRIAILGHGNVGGTLGPVWAAAGHEVTFGLRGATPEKVAAVTARAGNGTRATGVAESVADAEAVLLATPWAAVPRVLEACGDLDGRILVDATNPLAPALAGLEVGHDTSGGEEVARRAPGARVVKAFNTIGSMHMDHPDFGGLAPSMLVCGDDDAAKAAVLGLAADAGFDPVDAGPLSRARLLEPLALLWISMAYAHGHGTDIAFRLLRK